MIRCVRWLAVFGLALGAVHFFTCVWIVVASLPSITRQKDPAYYFRESLSMTSLSVGTLLISALLYVTCEITTKLGRFAPRRDQD